MLPEVDQAPGRIFVDGGRFVVVVAFVLLVDTANPAYEIAPAPALAPGPFVNNLTSSLLRLSDTCMVESCTAALAVGMEIPMTEEAGRALRDGPADADAEEEVVEGRRREAQDFLEWAGGGGATDVAVDVGGET